MAGKAKLSIEWLSVCSGCEVGIVDLHEKLLNVLQEVDLVRCPILMDTKEHVDADIGIVTGSLRTDHDIESAHKMRKACKTIIGFGTCAVYGGPQGAGYAHTTEELLNYAYVKNPTTNTTNIPTEVPKLMESNRPLDAEIDVDIYVPGCPPHASYIFEGLLALLRNREPKFGRHNVCYHCNRAMIKTDVAAIRRAQDGEIDPKVCFLSQGIPCLGSVSLDRCLAPCPKIGVACFGCGGPSESIILEPQKDLRTEVAERMAHLTKIPHDTIVQEMEDRSKTYYAYAMASPVYRQKPTFLLRKWIQKERTAH